MELHGFLAMAIIALLVLACSVAAMVLLFVTFLIFSKKNDDVSKFIPFQIFIGFGFATVVNLSILIFYFYYGSAELKSKEMLEALDVKVFWGGLPVTLLIVVLAFFVARQLLTHLLSFALGKIVVAFWTALQVAIAISVLISTTSLIIGSTQIGETVSGSVLNAFRQFYAIGFYPINFAVIILFSIFFYRFLGKNSRSLNFAMQR